MPSLALLLDIISKNSKKQSCTAHERSTYGPANDSLGGSIGSSIGSNTQKSTNEKSASPTVAKRKSSKETRTSKEKTKDGSFSVAPSSIPDENTNLQICSKAVSKSKGCSSKQQSLDRSKSLLGAGQYVSQRIQADSLPTDPLPHHSLNISQPAVVAVSKCWYAVDPQGNLPTTRATMSTFLKPYADKWSWRGFVGQAPSEGAFKSFHESSDLFIYCGHGAGETMCDVHRLRKHSCPAALLWGCSSGR